MVEVMNLARLAVLPGLAAAVVVACLTPAAADQADEVDVRLEFYGFAGLHVLTNRTVVKTAGGNYRIDMDLDTRGLASVFVDLQSHSVVHGRLAGELAYPEAYRGQVRRNGEDSHYAVDYRPDGSVASKVIPASVKPRTRVADGQKRGTVDQLTAYFMLERHLADTGSCNLLVRVFDGRSRYNLHFTDASAEDLSEDPYHHLAGPTRICAVRRKDISGFRVGEAHTEGAYRGVMRYARLGEGDLMVPIQMEFSTEFGVVDGYLAEIHGRGIDRRFMR
jgi:uncharacterized protein DUF3108